MGEFRVLEQAKSMFQKLLKHPLMQSKIVIFGATGAVVVAMAAALLVGASPAVMDQVRSGGSSKNSAGSSPSPSGKTNSSGSPSPGASGSTPSPSSSSSASPSASSQSVAPPTEMQLAAMEMGVYYFENYNWYPHSRISLVQTLESSGYDLADARYAVNAIDVDWNSSAEVYAQNFLGIGIGSSKQEVIAMLRAEEYTLAEATHGVNAIGADWVDKAVDRGREHLYGESSDGTRYTRSRMITLLTSAGFTQSEATQAVDSDYLGEGTWVSEAISKAYDIYDAGDPGDAGLVSALVAYGFTPAQARQGADEIQTIRPPSED
jgi:hypothetical protein